MNIIKARQELLKGKTIYDMPLKVADYGRVSTDKEDQLNSLENQVNYFNDFIGNIKNWTHVKSYTDEGISGTQVNKREQFLKMIKDAEDGKIDLILTKEVSRFARNTIDSIKYTELLLEYGVIVFFISDNINTIYPDSEFRLTLMASMAQDEVRKLSERVKFGIKRSIKDGKLGGSALYGYNKKNGKLSINKKEAPMVKMLFDLYLTEEYGFKKIGEILANEGYLTKKNKIFSETTLKKMLQNYRYKGYYTANLSLVEDYKTHKKKKIPKENWIIYKDKSIPAIVSEEVWDKANAIYHQRQEKWHKNALNKEVYLQNNTYTAKLFCQEHNTTFIKNGASKRKKSPVWVCNEYLRHGLKGCVTPIIKEDILNNIFTDELTEFIPVNKIFKQMVNDYQMIIKENKKNISKQMVKNKLQEQECLKDKLLDLLLNDLITKEEYQNKYLKINMEINKLNNILRDEESIKESNNSKQIRQIKNGLKAKLNVANNIGKYFNILVNKVLISKIKGNRNHLKLEIIFNFEHPNKIREINLS